MKNSLGKIRFLFLSLSVAAVLWFAQTDFVKAASVVWDGGGGDGKWETAANWNGDAVPTSADDVSWPTDGGIYSVTLSAGQTANFNTLAVSPGDGMTVVDLYLYGNIGTGGSITINAEGGLYQMNKVQQTISGDLIVDGVLSHGNNTASFLYSVNFSANNITVGASGQVNVDQVGFTGGIKQAIGNGPGGGGLGNSSNSSGGGGGGHGGDGGNSSNSAGTQTVLGGTGYCSASNPATLGSGGGGGYSGSAADGGVGGGLVILNATTTLTINGAITADGGNGTNGTNSGGGGAGGGVKLTANTIAGTPTSFTVTGGNGATQGQDGGGGGGGCVYLQYATSNSIPYTSITMNGGTGLTAGGAGIAYIKQDGTNGDLFLINAGTAGAASTQGDSSITANTLTVRGGAIYTVTSTKALTLIAADPFVNSQSTSTIRISSGTFTPTSTTGFTISSSTFELWQTATLTASSSLDVTLANATTTLGYFTSSIPLTLNSLTVGNGSTVKHLDNSTAQTHVVNISAGSVTVNAGGSINVDGLGYSGGARQAAGQGTGGGGAGTASNSSGGGGGGHSGDGGAAASNGSSVATGGVGYCDVTSPATIGSGGGGGYSSTNGAGGDGGGLIILSITNTLTVNGTITADGNDAQAAASNDSGGGGAGGGIKIVAGTIAGSPQSFTVTGGNGFTTGDDGGGGGGGCAYLQYTTSNSITGTSITMNGGTGATAGGAGVTYTKQVGANGDLFSINSGVSGSASTTQSAASITADTLTIQNGAIYIVTSTKALTLISADPFSNNQNATSSTIKITGGTFTPTSTTNFTISSTTLELWQTSTLTSSSSLNIILNTSTLTLGYFNTTTNALTLSSLTVNGGSTVNHLDNSTAQTHIVKISASSMTVNAGGSINVDGLGWNGGVSTGTGINNNGSGTGGGVKGGNGSSAAGGGGAHAGGGAVGGGASGGFSSTSTASYCAFSNPQTIGSGGGAGYTNGAHGGDGGGLVVLNITNTLTINGTITADGSAGVNTTRGGGGGSGGAVNITAGTIAGTPSSFTVTGGNGQGSSSAGGGGGGGCAYLQYTTSNSIPYTSITMSGGGGNAPGGAGVVYIKQTNTNGDLFSINAGTAGAAETTQADSPITANTLTVRGGSIYTVTTTQALALIAADPFVNSQSTSTVRVSGGTFTPTSTTNFIVSSSTLELWQTSTITSSSSLNMIVAANGTLILGYFNTTTNALTLNSLTVNNSGLINHLDNSTAQTHIVKISAGSMTIDSGGSINVDGLGWNGGVSTGTGINNNGSGTGGGVKGGNVSTAAGGGGAHSGNGGTGGGTGGGSGGTAYCTATNPQAIGSGGGAGYTNGAHGGDGGGLVVLNITNTLTINGTITADGSAGVNLSKGGGGGSGGAVNITAGTIAGTPSSFTVIGGNGQGTTAGGGGGGGCVYMTYNATLSFATSTITISGGTGANSGITGAVDAAQSASAPTASAITPTQSGATTISLSTTVADSNNDATSLILEYSTDNSTWASSTIGSVTVSEGSITTSTGQISGIDTNLDGSVNLTIQWNAGADINNTDDTTVYFRIIPNDGTANGSTQTSAAFAVDTKSPTTPGNLAVTTTSTNSVLLTYSSATVDTNFQQYIIYYKAGASGVAITDTAFSSSSDANLGAINFNGATTTTIPSLTPNTQYVTNIWAYDSYGRSTAAAAEQSFYTVPAVPGIPAVTNVNTSTLTLTWNANGNPGSTVYDVHFSGGAQIATTTATTLNITSLTSNTSYQFTVRAEHLGFSGTYTDYSSASTVTTTLSSNSAPTATAITPSQTTAGIVTFTTTVADANSDATTLLVEYSLDNVTWASSTLATVTPSEGSITTSTGLISGIDTNLDGSVDLTIQWSASADINNTDDTTVYFRVIPNDGTTNGSTITSGAFAVDTKAPTTPGNLTMNTTSTASAILNFGSATVDTNFVQYKVFYKAGASGVTESDTALTSTTDANLGSISYGGASTTTISGLTPNTQYVTNIWAYDSYSRSTAAAAEQSFYTVPAALGTPTVSNVSTSTLTLTWNANSNSGSTVYDVHFSGGAQIATTTATTLNVANLTPNTSYQFTVRVEYLGSSGTYTSYSSASTATTTLNTNAAPTATTITPVQSGATSITVTTTIADTNSDITSLILEYSTDNSTWASSTIGNVTVSEGSITTSTGQISGIDTNLDGSVDLTVIWNAGSDINNTDDTSVYFRITPNDGTANGSTQTSAAFAVDTLVPTAPGNLSISSTSTQTVTFSYGSQTTETNFSEYKIFYKTGSSGVTVSDSSMTSSTYPSLGSKTYSGESTVVLSGLVTSTQYVAKIWAYDTFGNYTPSASEVTFYTLADTPGTPTVSVSTTALGALTLIINQSSNPSNVTYSFCKTSNGTSCDSGGYVQADGTLGASAVWQTYTVWGGSNGIGITGLSNNTGYRFIVQARNSNNVVTSYSSANTTIYTLAGAVSGLAVSNTTDTSTLQLQLSWTDNSQTGMLLDRDTSCNGSYDVTLFDSASGNVTSPTTTVTNLLANTCYQFRVRSYNTDGGLNSVSVATSAQITTPPGQPQNLTASNIEETEITWDWDVVTGATSYLIYNYTTGAVVSSSVSTNSYLQSGLTTNVNYAVAVRAVNSNGTGIGSTSASATTDASAPSGVQALAAGKTTSTITWTWNNGGQTSFYARNKNNTAQNSGWTSSNSWAQSSLSANTQYTVQVKAKNASSTETAYTEASAYSAQSAPTGLSFSSVTASGITATADGTFTNNGTGSALIHFNNGAGSTQDVTSGASWANSDLTPNTAYIYTVYAINGNGDQTTSVTSTKYTLANTPSQISVALGDSASTLALTLGANSNPASTNVRLYSATTDQYVDTSAKTLAGDSTDFDTFTNWGTVTVSGLAPNTAYQFQAIAKNGEDVLVSSSTASTAIYTRAAVPASLSATANSQTQITFNWTANSNPAGTAYYASLASDATKNSGWITDASYVFTGLSAGTSYTLQVKARNQDGVETALTTVATSTLAASSGGGGTLPAPPVVSPVQTITIGAGGGGGGGGASSGGTGSSSSATVGGGSTTSWLNTATEKVFDAGVINASLVPNSGVSLIVQDAVHKIVLKQFINGVGYFVVYSDPQDLYLKAGEEKIVDVDGDRYADLHVRVDSIDQKTLTANTTMTVLEDLPFTINDNFSFTTSTAVILRIKPVSGVINVAVSESPDFKGASFQPYQQYLPFTLSSSAGKKTVYLRLRTKDGGSTDVSDIIDLSGQTVSAVPSASSATTISSNATKPVQVKLLARLLCGNSRGEEVKRLQTLLKKLGFFKYPQITSFYGRVTQQAVIKFQKTYKLKASGCVDKKTLLRLNQLLQK